MNELYQAVYETIVCITVICILKCFSFSEGYLTPTKPLEMNFENIKSAVFGANLAFLIAVLLCSFFFGEDWIRIFWLAYLILSLAGIGGSSFFFCYVASKHEKLLSNSIVAGMSFATVVFLLLLTILLLLLNKQ